MKAQSLGCTTEASPTRQSSTLELLATTVGVTVFAKDMGELRDSDGLVRITGQTDSQVSASVVSRGMTTSFLLYCMAMELSARLESARLQLDLERVPCETNQEADDVSNGLVSAFPPGLRVPVDLGSQEWRILGRQIAEGSAFFVVSKDAKKSRRC